MELLPKRFSIEMGDDAQYAPVELVEILHDVGERKIARDCENKPLDVGATRRRDFNYNS